MRVVHITNTLEGGAGKAVWRIHERLQERGLQSLVITKQESSPKPVNKLKSLFNQIFILIKNFIFILKKLCYINFSA